MELYTIPLSQPISHSSIDGDPATYRFAVFFISTLVIVTIGASIGIVGGNIAHYAYFAPSNKTNITTAMLWNESIYLASYTGRKTRLWLPLNERLKRSNSFRKTRDTWLIIGKPTNNRRW